MFDEWEVHFYALTPSCQDIYHNVLNLLEGRYIGDQSKFCKCTILYILLLQVTGGAEVLSNNLSFYFRSHGAIAAVTYDRGEPAVCYKWTDWVWEITGGSWQDCKKFTDHLRRIYRIYLNLIKGNQRMWTWNQLDLQALGCQPLMLRNLPDHWVLHRVLLETWHAPQRPLSQMSHLPDWITPTYVWEELAVSCRWTGWVRERTGWCSRLHEI